jgi:hypothetical protein
LPAGEGIENINRPFFDNNNMEGKPFDLNGQRDQFDWNFQRIGNHNNTREQRIELTAETVIVEVGDQRIVRPLEELQNILGRTVTVERDEGEVENNERANEVGQEPEDQRRMNEMGEEQEQEQEEEEEGSLEPQERTNEIDQIIDDFFDEDIGK